jgi:hypothetical protein
VFLEQSFFEEGARVSAQGFMVEQKLLARRNPLASVQTKPAAGDQVMDVGMKNECARPGVQHAQHAQLRAQPSGIGRQILQPSGAGGKEQIEHDLLVATDQPPQGLRHGEGHQKIRHGQEQPFFLALEPVGGVALPALRTMPVVAGMIAVGKARTVRALKELSPQSLGPAREDFLQNLPVPAGHGRPETFQVSRGQLSEPLMDGRASTSGGGSFHEPVLRDRS